MVDTQCGQHERVCDDMRDHEERLRELTAEQVRVAVVLQNTERLISTVNAQGEHMAAQVDAIKATVYKFVGGLMVLQAAAIVVEIWMRSSHG